MFQIIKDTKFDFIGKRRAAFVISGLMLIAAFYSVYLIAADKANMGLDFTGGSTVQVRFDSAVSVAEIRAVMAVEGFERATIQQIGNESDNTFIIRMSLADAEAGEASGKIEDVFKKDMPEAGITIEGSSEIGPVVSGQLKQKALLAMFWAVLGILIYIWFRFKFKFAVAATVATFHDVLVVLGIMVLLGKEIDLLVVTALLTLAGYSLNDTVVLFDRIRENIRFILKTNYGEIVNRSINEVLSRTIVTSGTTLFVVGSLYMFGGHVLENFSLTLLLGILVGTYSSIFVASPLIVEWDNMEKKNRA
ncbi:MAG: protein translocase subunit SecF [Candidatus Goldiibacteriota bacterium]